MRLLNYSRFMYVSCLSFTRESRETKSTVYPNTLQQGSCKQHSGNDVEKAEYSKLPISQRKEQASRVKNSVAQISKRFARQSFKRPRIFKPNCFMH